MPEALAPNSLQQELISQAAAQTREPVVLVPAWRLEDAKIVEDAKAFWHRLNALPPNVSVEERAQELCAAAYVGTELAGISTASI